MTRPSSEPRTRADGTRTYTTPEWDAAWYWPNGTRVHVRPLGEGTVTKQNSTTATIRLDDGRILTRVNFRALVRL